MAAKIDVGRAWPRTIATLALSLAVLAARADAQAIGSLAAERARLAEITGVPVPARSADSGAAQAARLLGVGVSAVRPSVRVTWNSALPFTSNDGALWAGRGWSGSIETGVRVTRSFLGARVRASLVPMLYYSGNLPFQVLPNSEEGRSGYANPFHGSWSSIDLPHRFGDRPLLGFDVGNSGVSAEWSRVAIGATSEAQWWGPGIRNALVMSNNAPGIPRFFIRTAQPIRSRAGALDAQLMSGTLTKSRFFGEMERSFRTIGGLHVQLRPAFDTTLTLGFSRVIYSVADAGLPVLRSLTHALDPIVRWEPMNATQGSDQISALYARWVFPTAGLEVYGEWARMDLPRFATELLVAPHHSGGWTFGFQWAEPHRDGHVRLQSELTYLEQSNVFSDRPGADFYTGRASTAGYTQRGQVIGAWIGPGSSSQFLAADWIAPAWQAGVFLGRIRWDNDQLTLRAFTTYNHHDVSVFSGVRGGWRTRLSDFTAELTVAHRYNYLFQNGATSPPGIRTIDVRNVTLALSATPR